MRKYLLKFILWFFSFATLFSIFANETNSYYYDNINWNNVKYSYNFESSYSNLQLRFYVSADYAPTNSYYWYFTIDWVKYSKRFTYDTYKKELYLDYSVNYNRDRLGSNNNVYLEVTNETTWRYEYNNNFPVYVYDNNNLSWKNYKIKSNYSQYSNYIDVEVYYDNIRFEPSKTYTSYVKIWDTTSSATFYYSSSSQKYYSTHRIYVAWNSSYTSLIIKDSSWSEVVNERITLDWYTWSSEWCYNNNVYYCNSDVNFSNSYIRNTYDNKYETLNIDFVIDNVYRSPADTLVAKIRIDWKSYSKNLYYDSNKKQLYTTFYVKISKYDLRNSYSMSYSFVNDRTWAVVYSNSDISMSVNSSYYNDNYDYYSDPYYWKDYYGYINDEVNWSNSKVTNVYDDDYNNLQVTFAFNEVWGKPKNAYNLKLTFAWKSYTKRLSYNASLDKLTATFYVSINNEDLKNYYYVSYSIVNASTTDYYVEYSKPIFKLTVLDEVSNASASNLFDVDSDDLYNSIMSKAKNNYSSNSQRIQYLERTIKSLDSQAKNYSKYKTILNDVNSRLKVKVNELKWSNSNSTFPMFQY